MKPRTLILRTAGTNCDGETAHAFELAGSDARLIHLNRVLQRPEALDEFQILAIPGGFSYGDDIAAGRIFANQIVHHLRDALQRFVGAGKPVIGICNGFQVLVKTDLLPGMLDGRSGQMATLMNNDSGRFIDRWIKVAPHGTRCIWTQGLEPLELPVAHGEGKFVPADDAVRRTLWSSEQVALTYVNGDGSAADRGFPANPNGSVDDIAGICDASGLILGLMPHPERYVRSVQHPAWTRQRTASLHGAGLRLFENAVKQVRRGVGSDI